MDFASLGTWVNAGLFVAGACAVWFAGTKLSKYADVISDRTGLGEVFAGLLLLAGATSLPELATTVSAAAVGSAELAVANVLGGVSMQTAVLAVTDLIVVGGALTFFTPRAVLIVQGVMLVVMLAVAIAALSVGDAVVIAGVGLWSLVLVGVYTGSVALIRRYERARGWEPVNPPEQRDDREAFRDRLRQAFEGVRDRTLYLRFAGVAAVVVLGGWIVAGTGEAIAESTGLGQSFVGATLVALSTSLPELSTTIAAARVGAYSMAVSNIFGSNAIDVTLLAAADVAYRDGSVMALGSSSALFAAALGIVLTCVYIWGLLERRDRAVFRLGYDSAAVLVLYLAGLGVLYGLRA